MRLTALVVASILAFSVSCGSDSPTAPSSIQVNGIWDGTYSSSSPQLCCGRASLTLSQSGSRIGGNWSTKNTFDSTVNAGTVDGVLSNATATTGTVTLTLSPSDPRTCAFQFTGTVSSTLGLFGSWVTVNCTLAASGTLILTKV